MSDLLFEPPLRFDGLPADGFRVFGIADREERRRAIVRTFHPGLKILAEDLLERLGPIAAAPLHSHLPRLDWPHGYKPFCTWLALSREAHGYQAGPQLNIGVHADHIAIRLGWDTQANAFGRFEFLARHGRDDPRVEHLDMLAWILLAETPFERTRQRHLVCGAHMDRRPT